jgi:adenine-specific DNA-methyltransferase
METLNYIGSKKTLINNIIQICNDNIINIKELTFADLFSGTGTVSYNMNNICKYIISNDLEYYSYVINYALLKSKYSTKLDKIINIMNNLDIIEDGLLYLNYSKERMFFTHNNAKKADAIRKYLNDIYIKKEINKKEFMFLLASIIISIDKIANTSSVYGAYLKEYKKSALKNLTIKPIHKNKHNNKDNIVYNMKMEDLIENKDFDIVYLDPPYNHRQYSGNYSPLNYIANYKDVELIGKTGLIKNYNKSDFCKKTNIIHTFTNMINKLKCKYIILSYNNEGLMNFDNLKNILLQKGDIKLYKIEYNKFKAQQNVNGDKVYEYIWFIDTSLHNNKFEEIIMELKK